MQLGATHFRPGPRLLFGTRVRSTVGTVAFGWMGVNDLLQSTRTFTQSCFGAMVAELIRSVFRSNANQFPAR